MESKRFMPTAEDIDNVYELAYFLVPDVVRAENVITPAIVRCMKRYKSHNDTEYRRVFKKLYTNVTLLQKCVFHVTELAEKAEEQSMNSTPDDLLIRYIKLLLNKTFEREAHYAAVSLGCYLYHYETQYMLELDPDFFLPGNFNRAHGSLRIYIYERFPVLFDKSAPPGKSQPSLREPRGNERALAYKTLEYLRPWGTGCLSHAPPRNTFAGRVSNPSEAQCGRGVGCESLRSDGSCRNQRQLELRGKVLTALCEWARIHALY